MPSSIQKIAEIAGVSTATVSRVFNKHSNVSTELAEKITSIALAEGYHPRQATRKDTIIILMESFEDNQCYNYGVFLLTKLIRASFDRNLRWEVLLEEDISLIRGKYVAGIISTLYKPESLKKLQQITNAKTVTINTKIPGLPSVCTNEQEAMRKAIEHLVSKGHTKVGILLDDEDNWCNANRIAGYKKALEENNLTVEEGLIENIPLNAPSLRSTAKLLKQNPTAIIACGEHIGVQVASNLDLLGKQTPQDISIISHECIGFSEFLVPPQTTLAQNFEKISNLALEMIMSPNYSSSSESQELVSCSLISRESVSNIE